jgi:nucleoside phosphorylase
MAKRVRPGEFAVGWIGALPIELAAAVEMLDEIYPDLPQPATDTKNYTCGRIGVHNIVAACLPASQMGTNQAATVTSRMMTSFPALRFGVLVGIGGGVPTDENDIRLGDVVISRPSGQNGGVNQYDFGKTGPDGLIARTGSLNASPTILLNALAKVRANDIRGKTRLSEYLANISTIPKFVRPGYQEDMFYVASLQPGPGNQDFVKQGEARTTQEPGLFLGVSHLGTK